MILITIGRNKDNRYVIDDPQKRISGYHAEIKVCDDNSISLIDHSSNGTMVNGKRIDKEVEVQINRGTDIIFGGFAKLDWSRIPVLPTVPPGTDLYSIGVNLTNRIAINDSSNLVSRYHATLKISPKGKMTINDHSSNGTFVNGSRIPSNQDIPIKFRDKILFANTYPLDWSKIRKKTNPSYFIAPIAAMLIVGLLTSAYLQGWPPFGTSPEKIFAKYEKSVVCVLHKFKIIAEYPNGSRVVLFIKENNGKIEKVYLIPENDPNSNSLIQGSFGTAFFIDNKGTMMTNRHVVMPWEGKIDLYKRVAASIEGLNNNVYNLYGESLSIGFVQNGTSVNRFSDFEECVLLSQKSDDPKEDVGLLQTKTKRLPNTEIYPINLDDAIVDPSMIFAGQKVFAIGFPLGLDASSLIGSGADNAIEVRSTNQEGTINTSPGPYVFGLNAQMTHGASGSPVLNNKGQLIGVFNSGFDNTQGLNAAVLAKYAKELYDKAK